MTQKCPFCGGEDLEIGRGTKDREGWPTYCYCLCCGAQGPWVYINDVADLTFTNLIAEKTGWNKQYLLAEVERLQEDKDLAVNVWCKKLQDQLQAAQAFAAHLQEVIADKELLVGQERKRVAEECAKIADRAMEHRSCSHNGHGISREIRSRYKVEEAKNEL